MKTLFGFGTIPDGEIALCEVDGRVHSMNHEYLNLSTFTRTVDKHPKIHVTRDMLHPMTTGDESRSLFLPVSEPFFKQVARVWYEQGITEALQLVVEKQGNNQPVIASVAEYGLKFIDFLTLIHFKLRPQRNVNNKHLIASFSQVRDWCNSPIRYIAWHPHCTKLAVALSDDSVRIYNSESNLTPILKCKLQKNVSCIAWRPLSASEIAIGCESCILIWTVDPNSVVTRPSAANSCLLRRVNHCPITSLAWSPRGDYLVSAAAGDSTLHVWDVALDQTCPLAKVGYVGNTFLSWVPDGSKLISASTGLVFRVWDCRNWSSERWQTITGRLQSACWSPCGSVLLFATSEETLLYCLSFKTGSTVFTNDTEPIPQIAVPFLDLSKLELPNGVVIGGLVQAIDWDPTGRYLAILFRDCNCVAVFTATVSPVLQITPCSLVNGLPEESPNTIAFQKNFSEGSCLTIAWSTGRIQYFPFIYSDNKSSASPRISNSVPVPSFNPYYTSF